MSLINTGTGGQPPEPFRTHAEKYLEAGLSVFPVGGDDGKKPLVTWKHWQSKRPEPKTLYGWFDRFPCANVAIVTGELSGITVVDSDNPKITLRELFAIYGETPLVASTPSGGCHLYYKYNNEQSKVDKSRKVDIRGSGGFVVAPPSFNPITGAMYHFIIGDIWDFADLPFMKNNNGITTKKYNEIQRGSNGKATDKYSEGERNIALFHYLKDNAHSCADIEALRVLAYDYNESHLKPSIDKSEYYQIEGTLNKVWQYKQENRLFKKGKQTIVLDMDKIRELMFKYPPALSMYVDLLSCHKKGSTFSIVPKGYDKRCGWSDSTVSKYIKILMQYGLIECVHKGGKCKGDVAFYKFVYNNTGRRN